MLTAQQLAARRGAIFSTDAAGCLGMSKYRTPVQIWMEKTAANDAIEQDDDTTDDEKTEAQAMGLVMQPVIGRLYENRTGQKLNDLDGVTIFSDKTPWVGSHFDFQVAGNKRHLVEAKNFHDVRRKEFGDPGSDDVPMDVLVQCLHEGYVYGADVVDVAVLFGGQKFEIYTVPVSQDALDILIHQLAQFWKYVETKTAPPPQTADDLRILFARDNGNELIASPQIEEACHKLAFIRQNLKTGETLKEQLETEIKGAIGENATLRARDGNILATWKAAKSSESFDKKTFCAENPSLYERYCRIVPGSRRFLLK